MARARYQVLVIPYCITDGQVRFCVFRRTDLDICSSSRAAERTKTLLSSNPQSGRHLKRRASLSRAAIRRSTPAAASRRTASGMRKRCGAKTALSSPNTHSQSRSKIRLCSCPASTPSTNGQRTRAPMQCCNTTATGPPCGN